MIFLYRLMKRILLIFVWIVTRRLKFEVGQVSIKTRFLQEKSLMLGLYKLRLKLWRILISHLSAVYFTIFSGKFWHVGRFIAFVFLHLVCHVELKVLIRHLIKFWAYLLVEHFHWLWVEVLGANNWLFNCILWLDINPRRIIKSHIRNFWKHLWLLSLFIFWKVYFNFWAAICRNYSLYHFKLIVFLLIY